MLSIYSVSTTLYFILHYQAHRKLRQLKMHKLILHSSKITSLLLYDFIETMSLPFSISLGTLTNLSVTFSKSRSISSISEPISVSTSVSGGYCLNGRSFFRRIASAAASQNVGGGLEN